MPPAPELPPDVIDPFLVALVRLCEAHGVVLSAREPIRVTRPRDPAETVRDRRRYAATDPEDGDMNEFGQDLYITVSAAELAADRIRHETCGVPRRYCEY